MTPLPRLLHALPAVLLAAAAPAFGQSAPPHAPPSFKPTIPHGASPVYVPPSPNNAPPAPANNARDSGSSPGTNTASDDSGKRVLPRTQIAEKGKFRLSFDKVDIEELLKQVADMTGKMFILPENIRGKISVIGPQHGESFVSAEEVYAAFLSALDANGLAVYPTGKFLRVEEKRVGKNSNIPTFLDDQTNLPANEQMVTKMFRVKYVDAEPIRGVVQNLVTQNGDASVFPPDLIIVNDQALNMRRLEKIITELDQPGGNDTVHIVQVNYAAATDLADKLTKIFEQKKPAPGQRAGTLSIPRNPGASPPTTSGPAAAAGDTGDNATPVLRSVIPDERTNKLIIIANDKSFDRIQAIVKDLDVPTAGSGGVHVYYLQNAAAEELANTLSNLAQGSANRQPGGKAPGQKPGAAAAELFSGEVKVTAEKSTNSLVIIASDTDFQSLKKVIDKLDLPRREVFVEAVIMEVNLDNDTKVGARVESGLPPIQTNLFGNQGQTTGVVGDSFGGNGVPFNLASLASFGGFLAGIQGPYIPELQKLGINLPSFGVLLHALQANNNANVLSTPHILTTDNEEAEITVGQNVPFQSGFSPSSLGSSLGSLAGGTTATSGLGALGGLGGLGLGSFYAPIQRQNVELKVKIKPQINEGEMIRMTIDEQTEEIASQDPVLGPTTSKRSAKTTIVVRDQQTVVIGGLIQERTIESVNKVPILGDIPLLGHLFREQEHHKLRTNLLLFLTPYIIHDQSDFQRIFERKLRERQQFVEEFYGHEKAYQPYIDYSRKPGPISRMRTSLRLEGNRIENGGTGAGTGERAIVPSAKVNADENVPPSLRPNRGSGEGEAAPAATPPQPSEASPPAGAPSPNPGIVPPPQAAPVTPQPAPTPER